MSLTDTIDDILKNEGTVIVLDGINPKEAGMESMLDSMDPDLLNKSPLDYFINAVASQRRRIFLFEEYVCIKQFLASQFKHIVILHNNLYINLRPVFFPLSPEMKKALLSHFSTEDGINDDKISLDSIDKLKLAYNGYTEINGTPWGVYYHEEENASQVEDKLLYDEGKAAGTDGFDYQKSSHTIHIIDEKDYVDFLIGFQKSKQLPVLRIADYTGDIAQLELHLHIFEEMAQVRISLAEEVPSEAPYQHRDEYTSILKRYWKHDSFRNFSVYDIPSLQNSENPVKKVKQVSQEAVIADLVEQVERCEKGEQPRDLFVTASTGAGKSVMFQVPAIYLAQKKSKLLTLVISPLIGLMNDQVKGLEKRGYYGAKTINSDISPVVKTEIMEKVKNGQYDILYLSPETLLARSDVEQLIGDRTIGMIVIDEAHIVTTWGKQFRPDYWYLGDHIRKLRKQQLQKKNQNLVIATFTATAIYRGREDMYGETIDSLHMVEPITYLGYVRRNDIRIQVTQKPVRSGRHEYEMDKFDQLIAIMTTASLKEQKTLIYFPTVTLIQRFSAYIQTAAEKMVADSTTTYYGQMEKLEKNEHYMQFLSGEKCIMLATKAFGMGIDIDNIVNIVHFAPTGNVCDYVQEIGRAARKPNLEGHAIYEYDTRDFKYINRLHGLSAIKKNQLVGVIGKIENLYRNQIQHQQFKTRKRNAMLLDAENFSYIFNNPMNDNSENINKVKTALLMIQKDFEGRQGFSPITVRPVPMFATGYFEIQPSAQARLKRAYHQTVKEVDPIMHICRVDLEKIWNTGNSGKMSFPKFKYMLYSGDQELEFNRSYDIQPACRIKITAKNQGMVTFQHVWKTLKDFIHQQTIKRNYVSIEEMADVLKKAGFQKEHPYRIINFCEIFLASLDIYKRAFSHNTQSIMQIRSTNQGKDTYRFSNGINRYFQWVELLKNKISGYLSDGTMYLVNRKASTKLKEISTVLGLLEAMDVLEFEISGGDNNQIYIYVNQELALLNIIRNPMGYHNKLLEEVQKRHKISVAMMKYMFENPFSSDERWDMIEDYFLGKMPSKVKRIEETL